MTVTSGAPVDVAVPSPLAEPPLPPPAPQSGEAPSVRAARSPITHLRYVALATENLRSTVAFYEGIWGLYPVASDGDVVFLGAVGSPEPFVIRVRAATERRTDIIGFGARSLAAVDELAATLARDGVRLASEPGVLVTPGGGYGFRFFDPEGRLIEVSAEVADKPYRELEERESVPQRLSHVVLNSTNVAGAMAFYESYLGLRLSDWLEDRMCFLRCSENHHSLAITHAPHIGLNHVSFEMRGLDEYMRGTGRMMRHGHEPLWGPGRHSSGDNVYSYFAAPDDVVVEYTTALEQIPDEDSWVPRVWPATPDYADRWGTAGPGEDLFALWHRTPPDAGLWTPTPI
ncbi:VOC family protein [Amycolatopsis pithecellobii]|uniref:Oxidoreductase n=1 Tax=Amycolatopsis pithecellobii TaxID=664692 RepID=A0A6N7YXC2_9PSEU|nr:VOC family protein [Amycolatopsis pithecellobii]MTD56528.1 oxidoreductase [Amycolatopsis pithecellobii]